MFNNSSDSTTPLHPAIASKDDTEASFLLEDMKIDVGKTDSNTLALLHLLLRSGDVSFFNLLTEKSTAEERNRSTSRRFTLLSLASFHSNYDCLLKLLSFGDVDTFIQSDRANTPLLEAVKQNSFFTAFELIRYIR